MNTPGSFGHGNALHAVHPAFELEPLIGALAFDAHDDFFIAAQAGGIGAHQLHAPAARFGITRVHAVKLGGEKRRFVAARAGANFHDDVLRVVGIFRQDEKL